MDARAFLCSAVFGAAEAVLASPAQAAPAIPRAVQVRAGPLANALAQLIRQTGSELLYDQRIVRGARASEVHGTMLPEQALARLLVGSGVGYRKTAEGVFILYARSEATAEPVQQDPVPEILVIGVRTQNADIRRTRNDIQPYIVSTRSDIENAHRDNVGQFFRSRIPADAQTVDPSQNTVFDPGAVNSQIDLRGLGTLRTLVLVDGRRMPSLPTPQFDFGQADINALPISAIERIETLTGTAGGIYGPGAIGGVVNIVLRRDYRGADIHLVSGITSRGDARRLGIEARLGFTPDDGSTDVMIFASRTTVDPLLSGQRDFVPRARQHRFASDPPGYLTNPLSSNAVSVFSQNGNLTLDPDLGGGALGAPYTFLPIGFSGSSADRTALLKANAGRLVFDLARDDSGTRRFLLSNPTVTSGILNVRHRFNDALEAFVDLLYFRDDGRFEGSSEPLTVVTPADAPNNPFQQDVIFQFPNLWQRGRVRTTLSSVRLTAGLVADFGSGWKGAADVTAGRVKTSLRTQGSSTNTDYFFALSQGTLGANGRPIVDPLGDWNSLVESTATLVDMTQVGFRQVNRFSVASLRVAGPLATLPGGPLNVTLLAERHREHAPPRSATLSIDSFSLEIPFPIRKQRVTSGYVELRAPVLPQEASLPVVRGLELQLAARYDRVRTLVPEDATPGSPSNDDLTTVTSSGATFTAGARMFPLSTLMLRGSVATGELPPTIEKLATNEIRYDEVRFGASDPLRGGRFLGTEGPVVVLQHGSHELKPERAKTISIGAVLNPNGRKLPRISIDYSRIDVRREVSFITISIPDLLANPETSPAQVVRAPLTDEDRTLGFTAGRVISIDMRAFNGGRTVIEAVDAQVDWAIPAGRTGQIRLYGNATWYPSVRRKLAPNAPSVSRVGYFNGPLAWRGNVGLEWTNGPLMIGFNVQYFDSYRATYVGDEFATFNSRILRFQGSARIPSQAYFDLVARRRFRLMRTSPLESVEVNFGIQNLFDRRPPVVAEPSVPGYSFYGDPRRRRFELVLSTDF